MFNETEIKTRLVARLTLGLLASRDKVTACRNKPFFGLDALTALRDLEEMEKHLTVILVHSRIIEDLNSDRFLENICEDVKITIMSQLNEKNSTFRRKFELETWATVVRI